MEDMRYVCYTIIPELDKYSVDNQLGIYPCPISIAIPSYGWIAFLFYDAKCGSSTLYKARLHSPVDKISSIGKNLKAKEIHCADGIIFLTFNSGPIKAIEFTEASIYILSKEKKKKDDLVKLANKLNILLHGTVAEITSRLKKYSESVERQYLSHNVGKDEIHFWDREMQPTFEAMVCADNELIYAAESNKKSIISLIVERDGVGLKGSNLQPTVPYGAMWQKVNSMCLCNGNWFVFHAQGISAINLKTLECRLVVEHDDQPCVLTRFGSDILFTNQTKGSIWQLSGNGEELSLFAGSDKEDGSSDGPVKESRFKQPVGICTEFESVVYICDAQANAIKICSKLKECARFFKAIGCVYKAFSVHKKGTKYAMKSLKEAISLIRQCKEMLKENTNNI